MLNRIRYILFYSFLCLLSFSLNAQTTIDQQLNVVTNEMTLGGSYQVQVEIKGTNLASANTLGSATIDVEFDNTALSYVGANPVSWAFVGDEGYSRSATDNVTFIRILVSGISVNEDCFGPPNPPGFDIGTTYTGWVTLNFTISDPSGSAGLNIAAGSNAIGLFNTYQNGDCSGEITNQPLTYNGVIGSDHPLPVELSSFEAEVVNNEVLLKWSTESEINNQGFEVLRSEAEESGYEVLSSYQHNPDLLGQGNTNGSHEYSYKDDTIERSSTYWYKIVDVGLNGERYFHPPINLAVELTPILKNFELSQNYPNPFNPDTRIEFGVPDKGRSIRIEIGVYDILGQRVRRLVNKEYEPGYHYVVWDGRNDSGLQLGNGIYFYYLKSRDWYNLKKMILIK
jgi:hypothetical protein